MVAPAHPLHIEILEISAFNPYMSIFCCIFVIRKLKSSDMTRPIKETPALKGKDAERFAERMETVGRASAKEIEEARKAYEAFKAISTFPM